MMVMQQVGVSETPPAIWVREKRGPRRDEAKYERAARLKAAGLSVIDVAAVMGLSRSRVYQMLGYYQAARQEGEGSQAAVVDDDLA